MTYALPPLAKKIAEDDLKRCDRNCLLKLMHRSVTDSRVAYKIGVQNLSDAARAVLGRQCNKSADDPVALVACYKNTLDALIKSTDSWIGYRARFSVGELLSELEKQDHFLARAAREFCGPRVPEPCFDRDIPLFGEQLRVARDHLFVSYYHMVVWRRANYVCDGISFEGACEQKQGWRLADFVVAEKDAPYLGLRRNNGSRPPTLPPAKAIPKQKLPPNTAPDPRKTKDDDTKPFSRVWTPKPFREPAPNKKHDPEACARNRDTMVANAGSRDVMKRFVSQVILFTCDVRDQLDHRLDEPAGALQSVLVMSAAASGMRAVGEELDLEVGAKYFGWLLTELKRLRDTPGVPGVRELGNLITYLEHAKTMNLLALFKIAGDRYKPDSELRRAFCPWKDAVEAAAPGSTKLFPVTVMYCPPATQGKR